MGRRGEMHQMQTVEVAEPNVGCDECDGRSQQFSASALEPCVSMHFRQLTDAFGEDCRDSVIWLDEEEVLQHDRQNRS